MEGKEDFQKRSANYEPLTPITFIARNARVFPNRKSIVYGETSFTWAQTWERCRRLASALHSHSICVGDTVAVIAPNNPAVYEMHFAVPMAGAVLNTINVRLDAHIMSVIVKHSKAKIVFVHVDCVDVAQEALEMLATKPLLVRIDDKIDANFLEISEQLPEYEEFLKTGDPNLQVQGPKDEWDTISINYTSGTTADPKGVVYSHRGAYLNSINTALECEIPRGLVYLWTLPMFHCNGWCFTWTVAALAGTNIIMKNVTGKGVYDSIAEHKVTHLCGAPVILSIIANTAAHEIKPLFHKVEIIVGGAPPPPSILSEIEVKGFSVIHGYGLTESYGPGVFCTWHSEWNDLPPSERAILKSRQGVASFTVSAVEVMDPTSMTPLPHDGTSLGEVMLKGNGIMKGYMNDKAGTEKAFDGGWFHTGDMGVIHPDGYLKLKDRSKDIIISGGENISSIEVEAVLFRHPQILEAAVVARPHAFWGETPCAFVCLSGSDSVEVSESNIIEYCRSHLPHFMVPKAVVFGTLPKTATGKVQKNILRQRAKDMPTSKL